MASDCDQSHVLRISALSALSQPLGFLFAVRAMFGTWCRPNLRWVVCLKTTVLGVVRGGRSFPNGCPTQTFTFFYPGNRVDVFSEKALIAMFVGDLTGLWLVLVWRQRHY